MAGGRKGNVCDKKGKKAACDKQEKSQTKIVTEETVMSVDHSNGKQTGKKRKSDVILDRKHGKSAKSDKEIVPNNSQDNCDKDREIKCRSGQVTKSARSRSQSVETETKIHKPTARTNVQFDDNEGEIMELQVENADNSEFPSDGEDEENAAAEAVAETTESSVSDDDEDCDEDSEDGEISEGGDEGVEYDDHEVSFNAGSSQNNNASLKEIMDSDDDMADIDPAEMKSMLRFAKFLEKKGFLKQSTSDGDSVSNELPQPSTSTGKRQHKAKQRSGDLNLKRQRHLLKGKVLHRREVRVLANCPE